MRKIFLILFSVILTLILVNLGFFYTQLDFWLHGTKTVGLSLHPHLVSPLKGEERMESSRLVIPSLNIDAPIQYPPNADEETFQDYLSRGVVHYPGTADFGEVGNVYIFGHSSDYVWKNHEFKNVLALLPQINIGDFIDASDEQGKAFTYIVTEKFAASPKDVSLLKQDFGGKQILTLQTSYPLGSAAKRYIVRAELQNND